MSVNHPGSSVRLLGCAALLLGSLCVSLGALTPDQVQLLPAASPAPVLFTRDIQPILAARCLQCHGRGRDKGGFRVDTRESLLQGGDSGVAVKPGKSQDSLLIELVSGLDPDNVMPKKGTWLTPAEVGLLRAWIDQGLPWADGVTFARPRSLNLLPPEPGPIVVASSPLNPIDQILRPYFTAKGVQPQALVEDRVYARRVCLDVVGLLPTVEDLERAGIRLAMRRLDHNMQLTALRLNISRATLYRRLDQTDAALPRRPGNL